MAESIGSLPPGLWLTSPAGWLQRTGISSALGSRVWATFYLLTSSFLHIASTSGRSAFWHQCCSRFFREVPKSRGKLMGICWKVANGCKRLNERARGDAASSRITPTTCYTNYCINPVFTQYIDRRVARRCRLSQHAADQRYRTCELS